MGSSQSLANEKLHVMYKHPFFILFEERMLFSAEIIL